MMEFVDLKVQYRAIKADIDQRIQAVINHGQFILGPEVYALEKKLADYVGVKHCIGVANGTDALLIAMMALGIGPGDEVITSPFSFIATAEMVLLLGAKPVFVDIIPETYNLDPALLEQAITAKTKLIMPVDLYGQCADYDAINAIANRHGIPVVADAGQSLGAVYKGRQVGSLANITCTSFFPSKPLGCYGDGGACFTDDDNLAKLIREIHNHGQESRYQHVRLGLNSRLASLQAAVLLAKMEIFPQELKLRTKVAEKYNKTLPLAIKPPYIEPHNVSAYAQYTIQVENRHQVREFLHKAGIPTAVHYPTPMHQQPLFVNSALSKGAFPVAEKFANTVLSLPFHPYLGDKEIKQICAALEQTIN